MHPALMMAVMEERDREIARRSRHAWKHPAREPRPRRQRLMALRSRDSAPRRRVSAAFSRSLAFFS
jgi:hypothetical protein